MKKLTVVLILLLTITSAQAATRMNIYIMVDLSDTNPHHQIKQIAQKSAAYTDKKLSDLALGSTVSFIPFGEYNAIKNANSFNLPVLKRNGYRPREIRSYLKTIIGRLPELVGAREIRPLQPGAARRINRHEELRPAD